VTFTAGDANSGQPVPPTSRTNADGRAGVKWILGAVAGAQTMVAKPTGNGAPANLSVTFTATAASAIPAKMDKVAGDGQTATAGTAVATAPAVKVSDGNGNPVAGVAVTFAVATGGGSVNPTTPMATNAAGIASLTSWTLGSTAGPNTLTATIPGTGVTGNPGTFTATGVAGSAGQLAIIQQPSTTARSGTPFAQQPKLQVEDAKGNPVKTAGMAVTAAIASGTGGTLSGQLTVATDSKGIATFSNLAITGTEGSYTLGFTNPTLSGATSSPIALAAGAAAQLAITTQPPSSAQSGVVFSQHPVVQVQDAQGNPVAQAGVAVTAALNSGGGSLGGTTVVNTGGTGSATFTDLAITGPTGAYTIKFSAPAVTSTAVTSTTIAIGAGVATKLEFTHEPSNVTAGAHISPAVQVTIEDGSGNVVSSATDPVTIAIGTNPGGGTLSGTLTVAAAGGVATFSDLSINKAGNGYTLAATSGSLSPATSGGFNVTAGIATQITANVVLPASATAGTQVSPSPSVIVTDAEGNPVGGVQVTFAVTAGGGSTAPSSPATRTTNGSGVAALTSWTLGSAVGTNTLTATASGLSGSPVTFQVSGTAGAAATIAANSATTQSGVTVGTNVPAAPSVLLTDSHGNPVAGVTVTFTVTQGGGTISPSSPAHVNTDASGIAALTSWTVGTTPGTNTVQATASVPSGSPVPFTATAVVGAPATITINTQPFSAVPTSGVAFDQQPVVTVTDGFGNPVPSVQVTASLATISGSGTLGGSNNPVTTDGSGVATFTDLSITGSGTFEVVFTAGAANATSNPLVYP
jgi:hypothetical protein